jgi:hypothetical protein
MAADAKPVQLALRGWRQAYDLADISDDPCKHQNRS